MKKTNLFPIVFILIPLIVNLGCGGGVTGGDGPTNEYKMVGGVVKNLDIDSVQTVVYLERNDSLYGGAQINIGIDTLEYDPVLEIYSFEDAAADYPYGNYGLKLSDSPDLSEIVPFAIPGDFQITSVQLPDNRVNNGGDPVPIIWSLSLGSSGYFFSVVLKDSAYVTAGYSEFVTTGTASATVPRDAFQLYSDLDTGWYYVYVCGYSGSPNSDYMLPSVIPANNFSDNITTLLLTGQFGAITVTPHDSIHVTLQ